MFDELHDTGRFDGAVVVSNRKGIFFEGGYGWADAERQVPFTPDTPTDGASLAKTFTAALVLSLTSNEILDLDLPAKKWWLPELPYPDVTLRHLLSHTSAIPVRDYDFFAADLPPDAVRTTESLLRILAERKPELSGPPGRYFAYSSFGYDLAALAAERAAKAKYFDLLQARFFAPLGITSAFVRPGRFADFPGVRTRAYRHDGLQLVPNDVFDGEAFYGGSNLYISARDLDRWNTSFLRDPRLPEAALLNDLRPAQVFGASSGLTLGSWYRQPDNKKFWYSGHLQGFHSEVFRDLRQGWSVVYVSNNTIDPWLQKGLVRAILRVLSGEAYAIPVPPEVEAIGADERRHVAGTYTVPEAVRRDTRDDDPLQVTHMAGRLFVDRWGARYEAFEIGPGAFYVPGLDFVLGFARDPREGAWRLYLSSNVDQGWVSRQARR